MTVCARSRVSSSGASLPYLRPRERASAMPSGRLFRASSPDKSSRAAARNPDGDGCRVTVIGAVGVMSAGSDVTTADLGS